jgi:hypothetical protein
MKPGKPLTEGKMLTEITKIMNEVDKIQSPAPRAIKDLGDLLWEGSREIAVLTIVARSHAFEFQPVMEALERLSKITDWSHKFMVADDLELSGALPKRIRFDWRDAVYRHYADFNDFYRRELEPAWGKWEDLQRTWNDVVNGKSTEQDALERIRAFAKEAHVEAVQGLAADPAVTPLATEEQAKRLRAEGGKKGGRGRRNLDGDANKVSKGTTATYLVRRLKRDHPEIAEALARGEFKSARAAGIAAGIVKPKTPLDHLRHWWKKADSKERKAFHKEITTP